jgi:hypothetical protein
MPTATAMRATNDPKTSPSKDAPSTPAVTREETTEERAKDHQPERAPIQERLADDLYDNIPCTD